MKTIMIFIFILFLFVVPSESKTFLSFATGPIGGVYYPLGVGISNILNDKLHSMLHITPETSTASVNNINLLGNKQIELTIAQNDVAFWGFVGQNMFKTEYKNLRIIASLYPEQLHFIINENQNINSLEDIVNKRVAVGAPGSAVMFNIDSLLNLNNITVNDIDAYFLNLQQMQQMFQDNHIDAGFTIAGYPVPWITELALFRNINILSLSNTVIASLLQNNSFYVPSIIPAHTYNNKEDISTVSVMAVLLCDADLSEDVVYSITKTFWDNIQELHMYHIKAKQILLENALIGISSIPIHSGALKYYKTVGIID